MKRYRYKVVYPIFSKVFPFLGQNLGLLKLFKFKFTFLKCFVSKSGALSKQVFTICFSELEHVGAEIF